MEEINNESKYFYILDMEKEFKKDMKEGNGFIITDKNGTEKNRIEVRTENGIFSPKYGSIWQDENAFKELYSCDCGKLQGRANLHLVCPECGSKVIFRDKNLDMTGYFELRNYNIIHPQLYKFIASLIGKKRFTEILKPNWKTESNGKSEKPIINEKTKSIDKYNNIGMIEFINRIDEILEFFMNKKKNKKDVYDFIMENRDKILIKHIPVISLILRPIVVEEEDYSYTPLNKEYAIMSTKVYNINNKYPNITEKNEKIVNKLLFSLQLRLDNVTQMLQQSLNKKKGLIRNNIHGNRYNFSSRGVIIPRNGGLVNEIEMCYLHFLTMGRPYILYYLCKLYKINISKAFSIWSNALVKKDETVYAIMQYIIRKHDVYVLLNRNPTLNLGSISRMKICNIKPDYNDLTISVPINILGVFAGDFDGDALNDLLLIDKDLVDKYKLFDPRTSMIISRNDGLFDNNFNLIKDQLISLHQICKLGNADNIIKLKKLVNGQNEIHKDIDKIRKIKVHHVD